MPLWAILIFCAGLAALIGVKVAEYRRRKKPLAMLSTVPLALARKAGKGRTGGSATNEASEKSPYA
jgi:hypothetical protein